LFLAGLFALKENYCTHIFVKQFYLPAQWCRRLATARISLQRFGLMSAFDSLSDQSKRGVSVRNWPDSDRRGCRRPANDKIVRCRIRLFYRPRGGLRLLSTHCGSHPPAVELSRPYNNQRTGRIDEINVASTAVKTWPPQSLTAVSQERPVGLTRCSSRLQREGIPLLLQLTGCKSSDSGPSRCHVHRVRSRALRAPPCGCHGLSDPYVQLFV